MTGILESEAEMPVALHQTLPLTTSNAQSRRSDQNGHVAHTNGFASYNGHSKVFENGEAPCNGKWQPFLIGVAGGTASGKVSRAPDVVIVQVSPQRHHEPRN
jgi:hypothetical protein